MKMLEDLEEVVRMYLMVEGKQDLVVEKMAFLAAAGELIATHHATIADMAKRLEAAERDAARYRVTQKITPYRFKKIQEASISDAVDVMYFHKDRFDAAIDAIQETGR